MRAGNGQFEIETVCEVQTRRAPSPVFPIFTASIGFFSGIYGLERIGSQVVLDYMQSLLHRQTWDELLTRQLEKIRLVNPGGVGRPRLAA